MIRIIFTSVFVAVLFFANMLDCRGQMSLRDCMTYAVSNSTKMRIQEADSRDARLERRTRILELLTPQISANSNIYYSFGRNIDPQTNTYTGTTTFYNNYGADANIYLFNGFEAVNNYRISRTGVLIAGSQEKQTEADICLAVMQAYYNVLYYKRLAEVQEEQVAAAEQALAKARKQEEIGQKGHADVVQMEAELADRQYDRINTLNEYEQQKLTLADLMFWPADEELVLAEFGAAGSDEGPALLGDSEESVVEFALLNNPAVKIADWKAQNAKLEFNTAKGQLLPSLRLSGGISTTYYSYLGQDTTMPPFWGMFNANLGEYVQLSLSIPIWGRLNRQATVSKKRNAYKRATAELDQKRREVETEVRKAIQDRDGSAAAWLQAQRKAEVQTEAYHLNLKKLEQGLISPLEFQTANNNYLRAQADEMSSQFKYLIKQAVVKYYNGVDYLDQ